MVKREAEEIRSSYEELTELQDLLKVGMGKEALSLVLKWLNNEKKFNLCKEDILEVLEYDDIPKELIDVLGDLHSEILQTKDIDSLPEFESDDGDIQYDEVIPSEMAVDEITQLRFKI